MANRVPVLDESTGSSPHVLLPGQLVPSGSYWVVAYAPPSGPAGGDLTGNYPNPSLINTGPGATGPVGSATSTPIVTIDAKGRVTGLTSATIDLPLSQVHGTGTGAIPFAGANPYPLEDDPTNLSWDAVTAVLLPANLELTEYDWDDVTLPASRISAAPGSNPPAYDATERCHKYAQGLDRDVDLTFEIQHSYVEGTDVYLHAHVFNSTAGAGNIRVIVKWRVLTPGIAPPAFTTDAAFTYPSGSTTNVQIISLKTVVDATATIASVYQFNLQFARNNVADTYAGDVFVASYGIHYQKNTVGSQAIDHK